MYQLRPGNLTIASIIALTLSNLSLNAYAVGSVMVPKARAL